MSVMLYSATVTGDRRGEIKLKISSHEDPEDFGLTQGGQAGFIKGGKERELYLLSVGDNPLGPAVILGGFMVVGADFGSAPVLEPIEEEWIVADLAALTEPLVSYWQPIVKDFEQRGWIKPFPPEELEDRTRLKVANWLASAYAREQMLLAFKEGRRMFGAYEVAERLGMTTPLA